MKDIVAGVEVVVSDDSLHINDIFEPEILQLWGLLEAKYPGYGVFFCYHNAEEPGDFLTEIGAEIVDDCVEFRLEPEDLFHTGSPVDSFAPTDGNLAQPAGMLTQPTGLDESRFAEFAALHDSLSANMFWNSTRISDNREKWRIFVLSDEDEISGYVMTAIWPPTLAEIFGVVAATESESRALLTAATLDAFALGKQEVLVMVETDNAQELAAARAVGFRETSYYRGYKAQL